MKNTMNNKDSHASALAAVLPRAASLLLLFLAAPAAALGADPALQRLRVSDNGRFLVTADGNPFFWLGDTAWHIFGKSVRDDSANQSFARAYFVNRTARGPLRLHPENPPPRAPMTSKPGHRGENT